MIKFNKLKVKGFKSFVEPTEIVIENGLTGIVGPNGCGKSNLVEAFRFVMGELSPKQMRGSELDDVIFNGTSDRPAWDIAEVTIDLDNSERKAPSLFNQNDEIEVTRRIWRGEGSEYRVNGKEVRLKDVQLLFADASTGARSTSMVSQGRVGAIIAAGPEEINFSSIMGFLAIILASVNIFGGFVVSHRMLSMFKKKAKHRANDAY